MAAPAKPHLPAHGSAPVKSVDDCIEAIPPKPSRSDPCLTKEMPHFEAYDWLEVERLMPSLKKGLKEYTQEICHDDLAPHPRPDHLAAYYFNTDLSPKERSAIRDHFVLCRACRNDFLRLTRDFENDEAMTRNAWRRLEPLLQKPG